MKKLFLFLLLVAGGILASAQSGEEAPHRLLTYEGSCNPVEVYNNCTVLECTLQDRYVITLHKSELGLASTRVNSLTITDMYDVLTSNINYSYYPHIANVALPTSYIINDLYVTDSLVFFCGMVASTVPIIGCMPNIPTEFYTGNFTIHYLLPQTPIPNLDLRQLVVYPEDSNYHLIAAGQANNSTYVLEMKDVLSTPLSV